MTSPLVGSARVEVIGDLGQWATTTLDKIKVEADKSARVFSETFGTAAAEQMAKAGEESAATFGETFYKGIDGRLRDLQGRFVSRGRAAGAGYTEAVIAGMEVSTPEMVAVAREQAGLAAKATEEQGAKAGAGFAGKLKTALLGKTLIPAAVFAGIGVAAIKMAGDFETGTTRLVTAAGESQKNIKMVGDGILATARETGTSTKTLLSSSYMIESAGFHGAAGLAVLRAAAQGAKVDMADAGVVGNALTTALTDIGLHGAQGAAKAATVMSQLVATVGRGKMTMDDLASSLHSVLPNATAVGLTLAQVGGAIATMTAQGISAQQATQNLNHVILSLANPTAVMTKTMAGFGLNATTVAQQIGKRGLDGTLDTLSRTILAHMGPAGLTMTNALNSSQIAAGKANTMFASLPDNVKQLAQEVVNGTLPLKDFRKAVGEMSVSQSVLGRQWATSYTQAHGFSDILRSASPSAMTYSAALAKMTGGQTGLQVALHLTGQNMSTYQANIAAISKAHAEGGNSVEGWAIKQKTFNQRMEELKATAQTLLIALGQKLLPIVSAWAGYLVDHVGPALKTVGQWIQKNADWIKPLVLILGAATAAWIAWGIATGTWTKITETAAAVQKGFNLALKDNPIGIVITVLAALVVGIIYAYTHFKTFRDIVQTVWKDIQTYFTLAWTTVIHPVLDALVTAWGHVWTFLQAAWTSVGKPVIDFIGKHWGLMFALLTGGMSLLIQHWREVWTVVMAVWHVAEPIITTIGKVFYAIFGGVLLLTLRLFQDMWKVLWTGVRMYWDNIGSPMMTVITTVFRFWWNNVLNPMFGAIALAWRLLWTAVKLVWDNVTYPMIKVIGAAFQFLYDHTLGPLFKTIGKMWNDLWSGMGSTFSTLWAGIVNGIHMGVGVMVSILNTLIDGLNKVLSMLPGGFKISKIPWDSGGGSSGGGGGGGGRSGGRGGQGQMANSYSTGGMIPGRGSSDTVSIFATPGEMVMNRGAVNAIGAGVLHSANNAYGGPSKNQGSGGHFAGGGGILGKVVGGIVGGIRNLAGDAVSGMLSTVELPVKAALGAIGNPLIRGIGMGAMQDLNDGAVQWIKGHPAAASGSVGGGADQWRGMVDSVLNMLGLGLSQEGAILARIAFESGGNPNAINLTDSNALAGHPSQGLLQVIPSTFAAYAGPFAGYPITDPLANIYAGVNYAEHRYGGMPDPRITHQGYDTGGLLMPGTTVAHNTSGVPEHVVTGKLGEDIMHALAQPMRVVDMDNRYVATIVNTQNLRNARR